MFTTIVNDIVMKLFYCPTQTSKRNLLYCYYLVFLIFAIKLKNFDTEAFPFGLKSFVDKNLRSFSLSISPPSPPSISTPSSQTIQYLSIPLSQMVKLVDCNDALIEMSNAVNLIVESSIITPRGVNVIAIDCEWRPENYYARSMENKNSSSSSSIQNSSINKNKFLQMLWSRLRDRLNINPPPSSLATASTSPKPRKEKAGPGLSSPVLVLQISTRDTIWVIDLLTLARQVPSGTGQTLINTPLTESEELLDGILHSIMRSDCVVKLGLGVAQDLKRLGWSYPWLPSTQQYRTVLDIQSVAKKAYPGTPSRDLEGLSKLCVRELGASVDKSLQCSDWSARPLSKGQIDYAALDASVLITLFDSLVSKMDHVPSRLGVVAALEPLLHEYQLYLPSTSNKRNRGGKATFAVPDTLKALEYESTDFNSEGGTGAGRAEEEASSVVALRSMGMTQSRMKNWGRSPASL